MKFACPHCDQRIQTDEELAGRVVDCPNCGSEITIPGGGYKYWAFLSYSHQDNVSVRADGSPGCVRWAEWLHKELESYVVPGEFLNRQTRTGEPMTRRFFPVFQEEKELPIDADLGDSIRTALEQSRFLIVICSLDRPYPDTSIRRFVTSSKWAADTKSSRSWLMANQTPVQEAKRACRLRWNASARRCGIHWARTALRFWNDWIHKSQSRGMYGSRDPPKPERQRPPMSAKVTRRCWSR